MANPNKRRSAFVWLGAILFLFSAATLITIAAVSADSIFLINTGGVDAVLPGSSPTLTAVTWALELALRGVFAGPILMAMGGIISALRNRD
ncbi:MAG: hypothetical protein QNI84_08105 [Henriciella sp.]|nr:hypothetical protein [Henriciella sp.]